MDSGLSMAKKRKKRTTLDEKIKRVMNDEVLVQPTKGAKDDQVGKLDADMASDSEGNDDQVDEEIMTKDNVNERVTTIKVN